MKYIRLLIAVLTLIFTSCYGEKEDKTGNFAIGWASADITPDEPVIIRGTISTGARDPVTVTALAIESGSGPSSEKAIMISCDLISIPDGRSDDNLRDDVRELLKESIPEISPEQVILNATHTHIAPTLTTLSIKERWGVNISLDAMPPKDYFDFVARRIATTAEQAWKSRKPGGMSYGLGHAVIGHNRLIVDMSGSSQMAGRTDSPEFSHIEGYEDHSVHLLYTWDNKSNLTGVAINVACPSQVQRGSLVSADYWHEVREELGQRLGKDVYILPQLSSAGDQNAIVQVEKRAEERMQRLMFPDVESGRSSMGRRKQIATHISDAVTSVLPYMKDNIEWDPVFAHRMRIVELSRLQITMDDVNDALLSFPHNPKNLKPEYFEKRYEQLLKEIEENPELKQKSGWSREITRVYGMVRRAQRLKNRYELQKEQKVYPVEVHVLRIGDVAIATNPFELYLDYGIRIKGRSPAVQTFVVQHAGSGTYLPTSRYVEGGAYGAVPASNIVGPKGGQELVESTLDMINSLWEN